MRKTVLLLFAWLCMSASVFAQSWDQIKSSSLYLYGEGSGATVYEADQNALADLISKITIQVQSEFIQTEEEKEKDGKGEFESRIASRVRTYSQATLTNTEQFVLSNEPDAVVGRYVKKSEVERIFESRKRKVCDMVDEGMKAEAAGKVDDALRQYYWAYKLMGSLPHSNELTHNGHVLSVWLPQQMNNVFGDVRVQVTSMQGGDVNLAFTFRGQPVSSIDYTYFDGRVWSSIYSAKDGMGVLEVHPTSHPDNVQLKVEYEYRGEARIDKELESVINIERSTAMRKSYLNIQLSQAKPNPMVEQARAQLYGDVPAPANMNLSMVQQTANTNVKMPAEVSDTKRYQAVIDKVAAAIRTRNYASVKQLFTTEGYDIFDKLIHYGQARLIGETKCKFFPYRKWIMARSVPMSFSFRNGVRKSFVEDVVFTFDKDSELISNITFGLGLAAERDIMGKGVWDEQLRMQVMDFMENYKTAYALKRLDYLESIFDDNAVIITGRIVTKSQLDSNREGTAQIANNKYVQFNRQSKRQYMRNLAQCFKSNEFINIRFSNNDVSRTGKNGNVFGIQIKQDYYSSSYGDTGYLFLMVDVENPEAPSIKVRTWQPEKDKDYGIIGLGHF